MSRAISPPDPVAAMITAGMNHLGGLLRLCLMSTSEKGAGREGSAQRQGGPQNGPMSLDGWRAAGRAMVRQEIGGTAKVCPLA